MKTSRLKRLPLLIILSGAIMFACAGKRPPDIGVANGSLAPCPDSPNCVSSLSSNQPHHIAPLAYGGKAAAAMAALKQVVAGMSGARIVTETENYLYAEFKSRIMGFIDDVEFHFSGDGIIHVRSASRIGYSDLGANRRRIETVRRHFSALVPEPAVR